MNRLKQKYGDQIEFRYVMSLLVRDVSDFMTPQERAMEPETGIYKSEESVGSLPVNMNGFCLFDPDHRSSRPLNLAYEAAKLADADKADTFLTELRHATVIDCLPATHFDEIMNVVRKARMNETSFKQHYQDGSAEDALRKDLEYTRSHRVSPIFAKPAKIKPT